MQAAWPKKRSSESARQRIASGLGSVPEAQMATEAVNASLQRQVREAFFQAKG